MDGAAERACRVCRRVNRDDARFCDGCGVALDAPIAPDPRLPDRLLGGRFRAEKVLGDGLRKVVYLAHDLRLDRPVALALLRPGALEGEAEGRALARVEREIRVTARLGAHPNIVALHDALELDGTSALVFEYVPGGSVADLLGMLGGRGLPVRDTVRIGEQVARALDAVHREGVYFRDLKPGNVLLTGEGTAKLCDFGLAFRVGEGHITGEGLVVGSLAYIAPERVARRHYDERSDLYALGVLLYELLVGEPPFPGDDVDEVGAQHLHAEPPPVLERRPDTPEPLATLVHRLLAKPVADRPQTAAEVAATLTKLRP